LPVGIALLELLGQGRFPAVDAVIWVQFTKHIVQGVHEHAADSVQPARVTLAEPNDVVNKDIGGSQGLVLPLALHPCGWIEVCLSQGACRSCRIILRERHFRHAFKTVLRRAPACLELLVCQIRDGLGAGCEVRG
jgi:hypothetical protein